MGMSDIIYKEESFEIMGACFKVYKSMGSGFLEAVYQECLEIELTKRGIPFKSFQRLPVDYNGTTLMQFYEADFVCYGRIILELKALEKISAQHRAQTLNYLKATGLKLGLILNFGHDPTLQYERLVSNDHWTSSCKSQNLTIT